MGPSYPNPIPFQFHPVTMHVARGSATKASCSTKLSFLPSAWNAWKPQGLHQLHQPPVLPCHLGVAPADRRRRDPPDGGFGAGHRCHPQLPAPARCQRRQRRQRRRGRPGRPRLSIDRPGSYADLTVKDNSPGCLGALFWACGAQVYEILRNMNYICRMMDGIIM